MRVVQSVKDAPETANSFDAGGGLALSGVEGYYDPKNDIIYVIADNVTQDNLKSTVNHELFHRALATDKALARSVEGFGAAMERRFNLASIGLGSKIENAAYQRVIAAKTKPEHQQEEFMAYLVTEYSQKPDSFTGAVKKIIRDFIAAVRIALLRRGVVNLNSLTPADLAALARYAISTTTNLKPISNKLVINGRNSGAAMASVYAPEGTEGMADMPDYEKQYQDIEAKYFNPDGSEKPGALLTPNGEKSKLNKTQWIQVRTQAFKDWFGDWETESAINELKNGKPLIINGDEFYDFSEPVDMGDARHSARKYGLKHVVGHYKNVHGGIELEVRPHGIKEAIQHGGAPDKLKAFVAIPDLITDGFIVYDGINPKNTDTRLVAISKLVKIGGMDYAITA